jgi:hypothetical protein
MDDRARERLEQLLDLLTEAVAERLEAGIEHQFAESPSSESAPLSSVRPVEPLAPLAEDADRLPDPGPIDKAAPEYVAPLAAHIAPVLARLALGVCLLVVLINIPFNMQCLALARAIPNRASLIIRNGLLVKEAVNPDIWVYRDGFFRRIASIEAFQQLGYRWRDVHIVDAGFVDQFPKGQPLYLLLKCPGSPHYYRLDDGQKRWIVDIPTFQSEGYAWQDLRTVSCAELQAIPDGPSIPPGHAVPALGG